MATYYKKWTKAEIREEIHAAMKQASALKESCLAARNDLDLSEQGQQKRISDLIDRMGACVRQHLNRAADMVQNMQNRLNADAQLDAQRTGESAHQLRVANVMKTLELRSAAMTKNECAELIQPIAFDLSAQQSISAAARAGGINSWKLGAWMAELYAPLIVRRTAIEQLHSLNEHLQNCWNEHDDFQSVTGYEADFVFGTIETMLNHWNDEMTEYH